MGWPAIWKRTPVTAGCWVAVKTTWAMARVWSGPTTWTGLVEKSTVAMPAVTDTETFVLVPVRKLWRPRLDSAVVGPSSRASITWVSVAGLVVVVGATGL